MNNKIGMFIVGFFLCLPLILWGGLVIYANIVFGIHCEGHLKRAADANTVELAETELDEAIKYLEDNKMTKGYTAVIYNTPATDVGFLYNNLKSSKEELSKVTSETTQLEKTNLLMKLRETLLDHGDNGDHVTLPSGISVFPYNVLYFLTGCLSLIICCVGGVLVFFIFGLT